MLAGSFLSGPPRAGEPQDPLHPSTAGRVECGWSCSDWAGIGPEAARHAGSFTIQKSPIARTSDNHSHSRCRRCFSQLRWRSRQNSQRARRCPYRGPAHGAPWPSGDKASCPMPPSTSPPPAAITKSSSSARSLGSTAAQGRRMLSPPPSRSVCRPGLRSRAQAQQSPRRRRGCSRRTTCSTHTPTRRSPTCGGVPPS